MRRSSIFTLLLILIVSALLGSMTLRAHAQPDNQQSLGAQPRPVLMASTIASDGSHAWGVYRNSNDEHLLVLIAPRESGTDMHRQAAPPGQVQAMRPLGRRFPRAIAATSERVYLGFDFVYANGRRLMRIYSAAANPSPLGGLWVIHPHDRLNTEHPIETQGELLDLQATRDTLWALLLEEGVPRLLRLERDAWVCVPIPSALSTKRLDLSAIDQRPVLIDRSGLSFNASIYDIQTDAWSPLPDALPLARHAQLLPGLRAITVIDWGESGLARLRSWSPAGLFTLAADLDLLSSATYGVLDSSSTLLGLRSIPPGDSSEPTPTIELTELSMLDNAIRYQGPPIASAPVSVQEFRFLAAMMILVMLGVLVVVILPDRTQTMLLPDHMVLADPGRRLIASLLDALIIVSIVARLFDIAPAEIITLTFIVRPEESWAVIPAVLILGTIYATLFEWLIGATPAKLIVGIRVARAQIGPRTRPRFWSALVRNIIKWVLPPVAAIALLDPESLHRGDRASRTLVVMPRPHDPVAREDDEP